MLDILAVERIDPLLHIRLLVGVLILWILERLVSVFYS